MGLQYGICTGTWTSEAVPRINVHSCDDATGTNPDKNTTHQIVVPDEVIVIDVAQDE